jgi:chorismate dehydratase
MLLSEVPMEEIETIVLDPQSRTSNILVQILAKHLWKKDWVFEKEVISGQGRSFVMIGDKVFQQQHRFPYQYDLAEAWKFLTGMPMVFAVWIAAPGVEDVLLKKLDNAFDLGMQHIRTQNGSFDAWKKDYLLRKLSYDFDARKQQAMHRYLELAHPFFLAENRVI